MIAAQVHAQIPSLDDPDTAATVASILAAPGLPVRVTVALQTDDDGLAAEVRAAGAEVLRFSVAESRGLGWARAMAAAQWGDEPWVMICDAHSLFVPGWAVYLAETARTLGRAVLTTYPVGIGNPGRPTRMALHSWTADRPARPRFFPQFIEPETGEPDPARSFAGGFSFAAAEWLQAVPHDPHLNYGAEEQTIAVRSWCAGWDLWHPGSHVAWHRYHTPGKPRDRRMWWDDRDAWAEAMEASKRRAVEVLEGRADHAWAVRGPRSLAEWREWSGMEGPEAVTPEAEWRAAVAPYALAEGAGDTTPAPPPVPPANAIPRHAIAAGIVA